jgi:hypothetical protein
MSFSSINKLHLRLIVRADSPDPVYTFIVLCYLLRVSMYRVVRREGRNLQELCLLMFMFLSIREVPVEKVYSINLHGITLDLRVTNLAASLGRTTVCPAQQGLQQKST